jgi:hypothetical protein
MLFLETSRAFDAEWAHGYVEVLNLMLSVAGTLLKRVAYAGNNNINFLWFIFPLDAKLC